VGECALTPLRQCENEHYWPATPRRLRVEFRASHSHSMARKRHADSGYAAEEQGQLKVAQVSVGQWHPAANEDSG
jgi:hypothetical protein